MKCFLCSSILSHHDCWTYPADPSSRAKRYCGRAIRWATQPHPSAWFVTSLPSYPGSESAWTWSDLHTDSTGRSTTATSTVRPPKSGPKVKWNAGGTYIEESIQNAMIGCLILAHNSTTIRTCSPWFSGPRNQPLAWALHKRSWSRLSSQAQAWALSVLSIPTLITFLFEIKFVYFNSNMIYYIM
jgi:hypothetical protein